MVNIPDEQFDVYEINYGKHLSSCQRDTAQRVAETMMVPSAEDILDQVTSLMARLLKTSAQGVYDVELVELAEGDVVMDFEDVQLDIHNRAETMARLNKLAYKEDDGAWDVVFVELFDENGENKQPLY